jgi:hypothetical protein
MALGALVVIETVVFDLDLAANHFQELGVLLGTVFLHESRGV